MLFFFPPPKASANQFRNADASDFSFFDLSFSSPLVVFLDVVALVVTAVLAARLVDLDGALPVAAAEAGCFAEDDAAVVAVVVVFACVVAVTPTEEAAVAVLDEVEDGFAAVEGRGRSTALLSSSTSLSE